MTTPALDAAIRVSCDMICRPNSSAGCIYPDCGCGTFPKAISAALRSLATPTPEVIEAMAKAVGGVGYEQFRLHEQRAALAAYWAHILGETK